MGNLTPRSSAKLARQSAPVVAAAVAQSEIERLWPAWQAVVGEFERADAAQAAADKRCRELFPPRPKEAYPSVTFLGPDSPSWAPEMRLDGSVRWYGCSVLWQQMVKGARDEWTKTHAEKCLAVVLAFELERLRIRKKLKMAAFDEAYDKAFDALVDIKMRSWQLPRPASRIF